MSVAVCVMDLCDIVGPFVYPSTWRAFMMPTKRPFWSRSFVASLRTELAIASIRSLALNFGSKLLILAASILLARWLGADGYGIYASSIAAAVVLGILAQLGIPTLLIRMLPAYEVKHQWALMRGLLRVADGTVLGVSLLLAALCALLVFSLGDRLEDSHRIALYWAVALVPITSLNALRAAALRGLRHVVAGQISETLIIPGCFVAVVSVWWYLGGRFGWTGPLPAIAVALRVTVTAVAFVIGSRLLAGRRPPAVRSAIPEYDTRNWIRAAGPLLFLSGSAVVTTQTDVLMLIALKSSESAGVYQAAARGAELVAFSLFVVSSVVQPTISRLHTLGDRQHLQTVLTAAARLALALSLPVAIVFALFARPILELVYGPEFERGAICLVILCGAQIVNVSAGLVGQILIMTGHVRDAANGMALAAVTNVVLNAVLIPVWEIEGAAVATGFSLIVWNVFLAFRVKSRTGLASGVIGGPRSGRPDQGVSVD